MAWDYKLSPAANFARLSKSAKFLGVMQRVDREIPDYFDQLLFLVEFVKTSGVKVKLEGWAEDILNALRDEVDLTTPEQRSQIYGIIRDGHTATSIPSVAPELFVGRVVEEASSFLRRVYSDQLSAQVIFQHNIRKLDPKLMQALNNEFAGRRAELKELLPPKSVETDRLLQKAGIRPTAPTRRATAAALRRAARPS